MGSSGSFRSGQQCCCAAPLETAVAIDVVEWPFFLVSRAKSRGITMALKLTYYRLLLEKSNAPPIVMMGHSCASVTQIFVMPNGHQNTLGILKKGLRLDIGVQPAHRI
jgi:hypothetical protein